MQCLLSIQDRASAKHFLPITLNNPYSNQMRTPKGQNLASNHMGVLNTGTADDA